MNRDTSYSWVDYVEASRRLWLRNDPNPDCGWPPDSDTGEIPVRLQISCQRSSVTNPIWRDQVKNLVNAGTAFSLEKINRVFETPLDSVQLNSTMQGLHCTFDYLVSGFHSGFNSPDGTPLDYDSSLYSDVDAQSARLFWKKLRMVDHQFQGGIFLGEIAKTVELIVNPANALKKGISTYLSNLSKRSKGVRKPNQLKRVIADTWLESSFGWAPLVSDCKDAARALARIVVRKPTTRITVRVDGKSQTSSDSEATLNLIPFFLKSVNDRTYGVRYYGALTPIGNSEGIRSQASYLASMAGFDFRSFLPTVWELIPWSFLIDYFTNVGDLLEQVSTDTSKLIWLNRTKRFGSVLTRTATNNVELAKQLGGNTFISLTGPVGIGTVSRVLFTREVDIEIPYQGLQFNLLPTIKQAANIVALIASGKLLSRRLNGQVSGKALIS